MDLSVSGETFDLAAAWEAFGSKTDQAPDWAPLRARDLAVSAPPDAPANEPVALRRFPETPRRTRLNPELALGCLAALDWMLLIGAGQIAALWGLDASLVAAPAGQTLSLIVALLALKLGLWTSGAYRTHGARLEAALGSLALGALLGLFLSGTLAPSARATAALSLVLPGAGLALAAAHGLFTLWFSAALRKGAFAETVVLVGATPIAERFIARAHASAHSFVNVIAVVDDRRGRTPDALAGAPVAGVVADLVAWADLPHVDRIVIAAPHIAQARVQTLAEALRVTPNRVDLLIDFDAMDVRGRRLAHMAGFPVAHLSGGRANAARALVKRIEDLILATLLALACLPVMAIIAFLVRVDSPGPALFKQRRHGLNNRVITIWKFRTMTRAACDEPMRQVCADDARVTRIGRFLRKTSLDELPQLFNVLKGQMSLVGPRPHAIDMQAEDRAPHDIVTNYAHRHRMKPGVTGWAQVNGSRGPLEDAAAVRRRVALDLDYIAKASLWLDLWIVARTLPALLGDRKNVR